jgi:circadian clock protein KaiC
MRKSIPAQRPRSAPPRLTSLQKVPSGISGFDEVTRGGLPKGRTTLVCGAAGCGKTLFGTQFLVRGALDAREPGVFLSFEETEDDLIKNVASLGFDLRDLEKKKLFGMEHVRVERSEIEENGEYDLEGLFIRIGLALDSLKAKRLVIDTLETIFGGLTNYGTLRAELIRLFRWLKERDVTTIVTAERGDGALTRHGLEEYVSDCVVLLDHRVEEQISTRRLRVVKYRGSTHGSNEYPFLIDEDGITVVPITSSDLTHGVSTERVDTGIRGLNEMLGGQGYYRGSTVLVSGTAGAGKSSIAAHFADATCANGERCVYVSFEESAQQVIRNMRSIGLDLQRHVDNGSLKLVAHRPTSLGLEGHLSLLHRLTADFEPDTVVIDPIGTMTSAGAEYDAHLMLVRLIDFFKTRGITVMLTSLTHGNDALESSHVAISSIADTWLLVKAIETNGERTRGVYVLKSRGMNHSNQIREFLITPRGVELVAPYVGPEGVLTGTARVNQEAREAREKRLRDAERERAQRLLERKRAMLARRIAELEAEFASEESELLSAVDAVDALERELAEGRDRMQSLRGNGQKAGATPAVKAPEKGRRLRAAN